MIESAEIIRVEKSETGTFGVLKINGKVHCLTLEPPDKGNAKDISCIPEGSYTCARVDSPTYGNTFEVMEVPDRDHILIHKGNWKRNTKGCILLGSAFFTKGERGVKASGDAIKSFIAAAVKNDSFPLVISSAVRV